MISGATRARRSLGLYVNGLGEDAEPNPFERITGFDVTASDSGIRASAAPSIIFSMLAGSLIAMTMTKSLFKGLIIGAPLGAAIGTGLRYGGLKNF